MDKSIIVTDDQLKLLKEQINDHKRLKEYEQLKKDLFEINLQANHTLTEFDGGMQQVDTEKVLSTRLSKKQTLVELFVARFLKMCALRPIVGNLIALSLALFGLVSLNIFLNNSELSTFKVYLGYILEVAAGLQIIKSAGRSIILPLSTTIIGAVIANQLVGKQLFLLHSCQFYQIMLITGLIGITISVFYID